MNVWDTYRRGFFLGPGFPRTLGWPSAVVAPLLTPFFLPSVGGPIEDGAGVPSPAGVAAFESDAASPLPLAAGTGVDGDSLTSGVS